MFIYDGNKANVLEACRVANQKDTWDLLRDNLLLKESFDMSTLSPILVYEDIRSFWIENDIEIKVYYPKWRWSKAIGYFTPSRPLDININGYKLNRSIDSIVGNFYHELVHLSDNANEFHSYGHGSNNPSGKMNTSPYFIGNVFTNFNDDNASKIVTYTPWWLKILNWLF